MLPPQHTSLPAQLPKVTHLLTLTLWADKHHHVHLIVAVEDSLVYGTLGVAFEVWVVNAVSLTLEFLLHSGIEFSVRVGGGVDEDFHANKVSSSAREFASLQYSLIISLPTNLLESFLLTTAVVPIPIKGS